MEVFLGIAALVCGMALLLYLKPRGDAPRPIMKNGTIAYLMPIPIMVAFATGVVLVLAGTGVL